MTTPWQCSEPSRYHTGGPLLSWGWRAASTELTSVFGVGSLHLTAVSFTLKKIQKNKRSTKETMKVSFLLNLKQSELVGVKATGIECPPCARQDAWHLPTHELISL